MMQFGGPGKGRIEPVGKSCGQFFIREISAALNSAVAFIFRMIRVAAKVDTPEILTVIFDAELFFGHTLTPVRSFADQLKFNRRELVELAEGWDVQIWINAA